MVLTLLRNVKKKKKKCNEARERFLLLEICVICVYKYDNKILAASLFPLQVAPSFFFLFMVSVTSC